jgi:hypothetical protein
MQPQSIIKKPGNQRTNTEIIIYVFYISFGLFFKVLRKKIYAAKLTQTKTDLYARK